MPVFVLLACTATIDGTGVREDTGKPSTSGPSDTLAVIRDGPAVLSLESLTGAPNTALALPGSPTSMVTTPDGTKAYVLDSSAAVVVPVDLVKRTVGEPIKAGKLPADMFMAADGTLFVTDNLNGVVIPIDTKTNTPDLVLDVGRGPASFDQSSDGLRSVVTYYTGPGQPTHVGFRESGLLLPGTYGDSGSSEVAYSPDGETLWLTQPDPGSGPGVLIPVDAVTRKAGAPIKLGRDPVAGTFTPDGTKYLIPNHLDGTVSVVDVRAKKVTATVRVCETPTAVRITADKTAALIACRMARSVARIDLATLRPGAKVQLPNSPADLAIAADKSSVWMLYPTSDGSVAFLDGAGLSNPVKVGNEPVVVFAPDNRTVWVANALSDTVQRVDRATGEAGKSIKVPHSPRSLMFAPDGKTVLVLSYGDGVSAGYLTQIDAERQSARPPLAVGVAPDELLASRDRTKVFVVRSSASTITEVNPATFKLGRSVKLRCSPSDRIASPDGKVIYATCEQSGELVKIATDSFTVVDTAESVPVRHLTMSHDSTTLYIVGLNQLQRVDVASNSPGPPIDVDGNIFRVVPTQDSFLVGLENKNNGLALIDPRTLQVEKTVKLEGRPDVLRLNADFSRAYVLDTTGQRLFVIDIATATVISTIATTPNAVGLVVPEPA